MTPAEAQSRQQVRLWSTACGISAFLNLAGILGIVALSPALPGYGEPGLPRPPALEESVVTIIPELAATSEPRTPEAAAKEKTFARSSFDQESAPPDAPSFIGERNTRAASDAPPVAGADPRMPSQAGEEPGREGQVETTESDYQEGDLASSAIPPPDMPSPPAQAPMKALEGASESLAQGQSETTGTTSGSNSSAPKERIATSFDQVERPTRMTPAESPARPERVDSPREATPPDSEAAREGVRPTVQSPTPGFNGSQRKTHIQGSITRHGRSALDVEDSLLGRYHAALSLAVEKEWNLNCVRNEKYLTEGKIIVAFSVEPSGKVRSLTFVEEFGVGNIQKGFTSESIRSAKIPPFPTELKKQLDGEPLEVTYSFTF